MRRGSGSPRRIVACAIDEPTFVVSELTADGYLRLHDPVGLPRNPLWTQFHEGQRIIVHTRRGGRPSVIEIRSVHLWRGRSPGDAPSSIENLWVDVGARSRAEAQAMGIELLDPVTRDWPRWTYGDFVAGPGAADRTGCAAVAAAASAAPEHGETDYVISVQHGFRWAGLSAVVASLGGADTLVLAVAPQTAPGPGGPPVSARTDTRAPFPALPGVEVGTTIELGVRSRYPNTLVESVDQGDAEQYEAAVARAAGIASSSTCRPSARTSRATVSPPRPPCSAVSPTRTACRATKARCAMRCAPRFPSGPRPTRRWIRRATSSSPLGRTATRRSSSRTWMRW